MPAVDEVTDTRLAYLRLHGRDARAYVTGKSVAERFDYDYSDSELDDVAERVQELAGHADDVHVIFNNNSHDYAPKAAERLRRRLGQKAIANAARKGRRFLKEHWRASGRGTYSRNDYPGAIASFRER